MTKVVGFGSSFSLHASSLPLVLVVVEFKKPGVPARAAFDEDLTHYKADIPQLFRFKALLIRLGRTDFSGARRDEYLQAVSRCGGQHLLNGPIQHLHRPMREATVWPASTGRAI